MENENLSLFTAQQLQTYLDEHCLTGDEKEIAAEISAAIAGNDAAQLELFRQFGECLHKLIRNVHTYRHGLAFGFNEIAFDLYGWLKRATFLDSEEFIFGDLAASGSGTKLEIGRGPNGTWAYGLWYVYGASGYARGLSVYDTPHPSRQAAIDAGLAELKERFSKVLGHPDATSYKQVAIVKTLEEISMFNKDRMQLSLF